MFSCGDYSVTGGVFADESVLTIHRTQKYQDGVGLAEEDRERIFERFYRVDKSHGDGGTGLGPAIVKHTAALHGGDASVETAPGRGCTFRLTIATAGAPRGTAPDTAV